MYMKKKGGRRLKEGRKKGGNKVGKKASRAGEPRERGGRDITRGERRTEQTLLTALYLTREPLAYH